MKLLCSLDHNGSCIVLLSFSCRSIEIVVRVREKKAPIMYQNIPIKTMENGHEEQYDQEQLVSMIHRLVDERDGLWRENEYLKSKLNESILIETINDMRRERELLFKLLLNLSNQNRDEQPQPQPTHHSNHHHHHHTEEQ